MVARGGGGGSVCDPCASSNHVALTADKDKCLLWSNVEEPIQWTRRYLASHINTRVRQTLIAKSVIGDERGREGTAGYFRSTAELAAVVVQAIFSLYKLELIRELFKGMFY